MYIIGLILSLLIGIVLGLIGGGGAILTIPLVVYFFHESTDSATTYSLIVVGFSSLVGVLQRVGKKQVSFKEALLFVFPSMTLAFLIRYFRKVFIPSEFDFLGLHLTRDSVIDILLVLVMFIVAWRMFNPFKRPRREQTYTVWKIMSLGLVTGALSGFLGAGGGFIIVPILLMLGLEMKKAIGTSLFIITIQSFIALLGDFAARELHEFIEFKWGLVGMLTIMSVGGVFIGSYLQRFFSGKILRLFFATLLVLLASLILVDRVLFV